MHRFKLDGIQILIERSGYGFPPPTQRVCNWYPLAKGKFVFSNEILPDIVTTLKGDPIPRSRCLKQSELNNILIESLSHIALFDCSFILLLAYFSFWFCVFVVCVFMLCNLIF